MLVTLGFVCNGFFYTTFHLNLYFKTARFYNSLFQDPFTAKLKTQKVIGILDYFIPGIESASASHFADLDKQIEKSYQEEYSYLLSSKDFNKLDNIISLGTQTSYYRELFREYEKLHYRITKAVNRIDGFNHFVKEFPNSKYNDDIVQARRMQYFDIKKLTSQNICIDSIIKHNPCYIPFLLMMNDTNNRYVQYKDVINHMIKNPMYRYRYIVADITTQDKNGDCKGIKEVYPELSDVSEFKILSEFAKSVSIDLRSLAYYSKDKLFELSTKPKTKNNLTPDSSRIDSLYAAVLCLKNYIQQVDTFRTDPIDKPPINYMWSTNYCVGQQMCFCELNIDTVLMIAKFITASRGDLTHVAFTGEGLKDDFYAPFNYIHSRFWDSDRKYKAYDKYRDSLLGGGTSVIDHFYKNNCELSDFMGFYPYPKYPFACRGNGIHELTEAPLHGGLMGTPSSIGCLRLFAYQAKWARWWTPMYAKLFIYIDEDRYVQVTRKTISK